MGRELKESDFIGFTAMSIIARSSKATLFVKTDVTSRSVTYCVESREYQNPFEYSFLEEAIARYNRLCK